MQSSNTTVSIVVVSRERAKALERCLLGLSQLQYAPFEIVVVADPTGLETVSRSPHAASTKCVPFDRANISAARNLGIEHAAGEVIAFIDDDAVPEPMWLHYLVAPFARKDVAAAGGFVRGRNGISFQWRSQIVDAMGRSHPIAIDAGQATVLHPPKQGGAIKTEGTNMAFRRGVLVELGGFDPAYNYFLDETDLDLRLAQAGYATALVPLAEVHHGFAENRLRRSDRVPRDLFDIGASWAVFQRKHIAESRRPAHWAEIREEQRSRVLRHLVTGGLEPRDVTRLLGRLESGYASGCKRPLEEAKMAALPAAAFRIFPSVSQKSVFMTTRPGRFRRDRAAAANRAKCGTIVTLLQLSATAMRHTVKFESDGIWVQRGGIFGRSDRNTRVFQRLSRSTRTEMERRRVQLQRGISAEDPKC